MNHHEFLWCMYMYACMYVCMCACVEDLEETVDAQDANLVSVVHVHVHVCM